MPHKQEKYPFKELGYKLKQLRGTKKQYEIAKQLGIAVTTYNRYEKGRKKIPDGLFWYAQTLAQEANKKTDAVRDVDGTYSEDQITRDTAMQIILDMNKTLMARNDQLIEEIRKKEVENAEIKAQLRFIMESLDREERPGGFEERRKIWKDLKRVAI